MTMMHIWFISNSMDMFLHLLEFQMYSEVHVQLLAQLLIENHLPIKLSCFKSTGLRFACQLKFLVSGIHTIGKNYAAADQKFSETT
jgi:hypothetical protein